MDHREDSRRKLLVNALTLGLFSGISAAGLLVPARALSSLPGKLPEGQSIYSLEGTVIVDGQIASISTRINSGSSIQTGDDSEVIFVVGSDAFILRSNSSIQFGAEGLLVQGIRVISGAILGVFGKREASHRIVTTAATIGIRGTGIYVDSAPDKTYACTCYGHTRISANADPSVVEDIVTTRHDKPVYILPSALQGELIISAPIIDHSNSELGLIESLVGRKTPFGSGGFSYQKGGGGDGGY
ncbi:MAG: hypothetical protein GY806_17440 [Gammaproteobacteria bacterium]|nr:hypothetical protein [Gammaproteobacteria bacterium]